ncbi:pilus assembly protein CpaE [Brevibacillus aydinogluensis]|jgi:pilus assembly protein CpaE|uniref:Pilus assembly protein CpaE n=1 Tax=Brevibacillus aydinogluensis TaxID=927786 RepID=A0AA48RDQ0_9BACL|nr:MULTISPECIES: AAA family ATPase [Brevibacillus]MBR8658937.1 AAA family ATPase [Brevibacillus sp. NL20B1]MDT3416311.1 pilus assembly protein CpaE [Brevibacillus aydinogluensis]REK66947.1 MAG: pilus assembly protein CpaE [Brevibacillus sp.]CAJ1004240.1 Pilus assembly protein CpaE [Brevibacillus aydinogluensis]
MKTELNILVVADYDSVKDLLREWLAPYEHVQYTTSLEVKKEIDRIGPDIVLLVQPEDGSGVELVQYIQAELPEGIVIFLTEEQDFVLLRDVVRAGAIEYIVMPDELALLTDRLEKISELAQIQQRKKGANASGKALVRGRGKVYSFYSGKGGSGRTLLATGFAQALKLESTASALLIDLNLQYGGVETFLSLDSNRTLADLMPVMHEMNENHIRNVAQRELHSKLEVLVSPRDAEIAEQIPEEFITRLIRASRRSYDFVIVDLPAHMNELTYAALTESDLICYVMNLDTPSVQIYRLAEELFRRLRIDTAGRLEVVVNQVGRDNELAVSDLKGLITAPITAEISRDHQGVQAAVNQGKPLQKEANEKKLSPAAKDIRKWVLRKLS